MGFSNRVASKFARRVGGHARKWREREIPGLSPSLQGPSVSARHCHDPSVRPEEGPPPVVRSRTGARLPARRGRPWPSLEDRHRARKGTVGPPSAGLANPQGSSSTIFIERGVARVIADPKTDGPCGRAERKEERGPASSPAPLPPCRGRTRDLSSEHGRPGRRNLRRSFRLG